MAHPEGHITFSKGLLRQGLSCGCSFIPIFYLLDLQPPVPDILTEVRVVRDRGENGMQELGRDFVQPLLASLVLFLHCAPFPMDTGSPQGLETGKVQGRGGILSLL